MRTIQTRMSSYRILYSGSNKSPRPKSLQTSSRSTRTKTGSPWWVRARAIIGIVILAPFASMALEKRLRARLGASYVEYCQRVPRFWPRLSRLHTRPTVELNVRCLKIEAIRALRWATIPLVVHLILYFRAAVR